MKWLPHWNMVCGAPWAYGARPWSLTAGSRTNCLIPSAIELRFGWAEKVLPSCCFSHQLIELSSFFSRTPAIYKPEFIFRNEVSFKERKGKDKGRDIYTVSAGQGPVPFIIVSTPTRRSEKVLIAWRDAKGSQEMAVSTVGFFLFHIDDCPHMGS